MADIETKKNSEKSDQEGEKLYFDSMKHLTTLNTGSVLLLERLDYRARPRR